jgi:hypothetical protein
MKNFQFVRVHIVLLTVLSSACNTEPPPEPPLALLAHDVYFSIAEKTIRLPLIAISRSGYVCSEKDRIPCHIPIEKINAKKPITVNALQISLENYNDFEDSRTEGYIDISELCPMLSQEWARLVCQKDTARHINLHGLQRFTLVKEDYISSYHNGWLDNGNTGEMVQKMSLDDKMPSSYCKSDKYGNPPDLCAVAIKISHNLLAVWIVTRAGAVKSRIARDAKTIKAFMEYGFQEIENFAALDAALKLLNNSENQSGH